MNEPVQNLESAPIFEPTQVKTNRISPLFGGLALAIVLAIGGVAGYLFSQAQALPDAAVQVVVTATLNPDSQSVAQAPQSSVQTGQSSAPNPPGANPNTPTTPTIMDLVLADARHFEGSSDAPVTMIEFSDFK